MNKTILVLLTTLICSIYSCRTGTNSDTFPPLKDEIAPQTFEELWAGFDPRKEPLDTEILKTWEEDGVVMQVLRYRVGIFKGQKAMIAAIYGYPRGAAKIPGLVQAHGGGQYADYRAVLTNAKRGYATISISWAGRINAPDYNVTPEVVKLFWDNKTNDPKYRVTTDWGALDGYHAPYRYDGTNSMGVKPGKWTIDSVESPRNCPYFLWTLAARRALTFLEQQPQVDPERLGIYGHSMGAKITVLTAGSDNRLKVAVPSCGGISNNTDNPLYQKTLADTVYLKHITCPIAFLSPANDFHGHLMDIPRAVNLIKTDDWRVVTSAHHSHQDHGNFEVSGLLWIDKYLKGAFTYPETPKTKLNLSTKNGTPLFSIIPDTSKKILEVEVYYTQQADFVDDVPEREHRKSRFWHYAKAKNSGITWTAALPLESKEKTLWAYANVRYQLEKPVTGAGYYYSVYTVDNFNLSSPIQIATSDQLKEAGVKATLKPSLLIEDFKGDWQKGWFSYKPEKWELLTHKIYDNLWRGPAGASLAFEVRANEPNVLVVSLDGFAKEVQVKGGEKWQKIVLLPSDFKNAKDESLPDWANIKVFSFSANQEVKKQVEGEIQRIKLGAEWKGAKPEFRKLQWIQK